MKNYRFIEIEWGDDVEMSDALAFALENNEEVVSTVSSDSGITVLVAHDIEE